MAVQPSVRRRVEHGFLMPPCTLRKVPLSFRYEEKGVLFLPSFLWIMVTSAILKAPCNLSNLTKPGDLTAVHSLFSI